MAPTATLLPHAGGRLLHAAPSALVPILPGQDPFRFRRGRSPILRGKDADPRRTSVRIPLRRRVPPTRKTSPVNKRLAVYTALTGGYDDLRQPDDVHPKVDYYCYSNEIKGQQIGAWRIRTIPFSHHDPIRIPRYVKLHPELLLPEYEASLWLDASLTPARVIVERAFALPESGALFSTHPHPIRNSVYDEVLAVLKYGRGDSGEVLRQLRFLLSEQFPEKNGLKETCILFRRHTDPAVVDFDRLWWEQICRFSNRDQLSCDYVLWKTGLPFVPFSDWISLVQFQHGHIPSRNRITIGRIIRRIVRLVRLHKARQLLVDAGIK